MAATNDAAGPDTSTAVSRARWAELAARAVPGGRLIGTSTFPGGLSSAVTLLDVEDSDGVRRRLVARRSDPEGDSPETGLSVAAEFGLVEVLHRLGLTVPEPLFLDASGLVIAQPCAVFSYVEGRPCTDADDPVALARLLAATMAEIHDVDVDLVRGIGLPPHGAEVLRRLEPGDMPTDDSLREGEIRAVLQARRGRFESDAGRLLHGDFWPGNVVVRDGTVSAVIDWEDAAIGDPLADVATTRLDLAWAFGWEASDAFTDSYLVDTGIDAGDLALWDVFAALRPAGGISAWSVDWGNFGRPDVTRHSMRAVHAEFLDRALAALD